MPTWKPIIALPFLIAALTAVGHGQGPTAQPPMPAHLLSSAAYAEVSLKLAEVDADIEAMLEDYTEGHPSVVKARAVASSLSSDSVRLRALRAEDAGKLTAALGKLIVRKAELFADYKMLQSQFDEGNPNVRRAKKRLEIFSARLDEILGK